MSNAALMSEEYGEKRSFYVQKIRDKGNENLAQIIESTSPQKITKDGFIEGLTTTFPEYEPELESLKESIEELQSQGSEAYDHTKYFEDNGRGGRKFQPKWLADDIEKDYTFCKIRDSEQIYVYKDGYYQPKGEQIIEEECEKRLQSEFRKNRLREVRSFIESRNYISREKFRPPKRKICLKNGVYDLDQEKLLDHSPEHYFTHQIPVNYNIHADCDNIQEFLNEIVESEEQVKTLREIAGYCLLPDYPIAKAFMLLGKGSNGKTQYLKLLQKLVGQKNIVDKGLQELEENRFSTSQLEGRLACIDDDLDSNKLNRTSTMKKLTGGSTIAAEVKYGAQFSFKNYAKLVFACNELPRTSDASDGFFRRWILVEFPYKFKENPDTENPLEKQAVPERELMQKITAEKELEGFLWWAVEALQDVLNNNEFTYAPTTNECRDKWREYSNPLTRFIEKYVRQGVTYKEAERKSEEIDGINSYDYDYIRKDFLAEVIGDYCEARNHSRPSVKAITRELETFDFYFNPKGRTRTEPEDKRVRIYSGLKLKYPDPEKCPGVPTYSETFTRVCAHARESSKQSVEPGTLSVSSTSEKVRQKLEENGSMQEQALIESLDVDESRVLSVLKTMKNKGDLFEPSPGQVDIL